MWSRVVVELISWLRKWLLCEEQVEGELVSSLNRHEFDHRPNKRRPIRTGLEFGKVHQHPDVTVLHERREKDERQRSE